MLQKYITSKQKSLNHIYGVWVIFQKILQSITWRKQDFSVDYNAINTNDILNIYRYLMKETWCKIKSGFITKMFVWLLNVYKIVSFGKSLAPICKEPIKCVSLNNQSCQAKSRIVNIHSDKTFFLSIYS